MTTRATGTFEVKLTPQAPDNEINNPAVSRMLLDKQFHGDLEATSTGQMLAARTTMAGSAGYVAIEQVNGTLHGRRGSFVLQHNGTMARGVSHLTVAVVPDSGTDQLAGLAGQMEIKSAGGQHSYDFQYTLGETT